VANPGRGTTDVLRCHLHRISDERMKRAFAAALDLQTIADPAPGALRRLERYDLWRGLKPNRAAKNLLK